MNNRLRALAAASGIAGLVGGCLPTLKSTFADAAYSTEPNRVPARDPILALDAALVPHLLVDYQYPREVARCLALAARDPNLPPSLWRYAECSGKVPAPSDCTLQLPWVRAREQPAEGSAPRQLSGCFAELRSGRDRTRALLAVTDAALGWRHYQLGALGSSGVTSMPPASQLVALSRTFEHAALLLNHDPAEHPEPLPVLSLSGGAANGAFVAGYLYGLLWSREKARTFANQSQKSAIDGYRFRGLVGSSVGTLVGLALDLYFSHEAPSPTQRRALDACIHAGGAAASGDPGRKLQDCALAKLRGDFVRNEWELLCARSGNVLELTEPDFSSMLKFDPLERNTLAPFFDTFGTLITGNAFNRTAMAVEIEQNLLVGLDERACRIEPMDRGRCLSEAVLASIVEPLFVPPRSQVFSGLNGARGEVGTWFDGSLRSLNPAFRATSFALGKVLAVNTTRAEGQPQEAPAGAVPILLSTTDMLGGGQRSWELAYARAYQRERVARACELGRDLGELELCAVLGQAGPNDGMLSVWVPDDVAPAALFAKGYTFDPLVMRGLFLWGQKEYLRTRAGVLSWLGWCALNALERADAACPEAGVSPGYAALVANEALAVERELASLRKYEDKEIWRRHQLERKELVKAKLETCKE